MLIIKTLLHIPSNILNKVLPPTPQYKPKRVFLGCQINKNGKAVAVVLSMQAYQDIKDIKLKLIKNRALRAKESIEQNLLLDGETVINELIKGSK